MAEDVPIEFVIRLFSSAGSYPMRPLLDCVTRRILPLFCFCFSICVGADSPVLNELNSVLEEPLINLPEVDSESPFRSASRPRNLAPAAEQNKLTEVVEDAIGSARRRLLATDINTPWQMMHGLLALRHDFQVKQNGEIISGLDWVSSGPMYEGEPWFERTQYGGRAHPYSRPWAFEGHANQFLAVLSMSGLSLSHQFQTPRGPITIAEMVKHAQKTVNTKDEPTWTLWALSRYLPADATWRNTSGETWSIERLVSIQTAKPLKGSACGGTHGLFALAHARNVYLRTGTPLRGVWLEAEYKIRKHINTARVQQNSNGMLSSNYFRGREYKQDFNKRMASAGHILEFLMLALPQDELQQGWVRRAIHTVAQDLIQNRKAEVRCSPLYHAVNGLNIYLDRVKTDQPAKIAGKNDTNGQLKPVDDKTASNLKSVPVIRISQAKPVTTEAKLADIPKEAKKQPGKVSDDVSASDSAAEPAKETKTPIASPATSPVDAGTAATATRESETATDDAAENSKSNTENAEAKGI